MSIIQVNPLVVNAKTREARIVELKKFLTDTDFKVLPDYDQVNENIKIQRQMWRNEIRILEAE